MKPRYFLKALTLILLISLLPMPALAELSFCNGVWTNQECKGEEKEETEAPSLPETAHEPRSSTEVLSDKKKSLVHEMTMKRIDARRKYGVLYSSDTAETTCELDATSLKDCQTEVDAYYEKLQSSIETHLKERELDSSGKPGSQNLKEKAQNNTTAVYIFNRGKKDLPPPPPPQNVEVKKQSTGIRLSGSSKNGNINVGFETNAGTTEIKRKTKIFSGGPVKVSPLSTNH